MYFIYLIYIVFIVSALFLMMGIIKSIYYKVKKVMKFNRNYSFFKWAETTFLVGCVLVIIAIFTLPKANANSKLKTVLEYDRLIILDVYEDNKETLSSKFDVELDSGFYYILEKGEEKNILHNKMVRTYTPINQKESGNGYEVYEGEVTLNCYFGKNSFFSFESENYYIKVREVVENNE